MHRHTCSKWIQTHIHFTLHIGYVPIKGKHSVAADTNVIDNVDGSVVDCSGSIANVLELLQSYAEPSIYLTKRIGRMQAACLYISSKWAVLKWWDILCGFRCLFTASNIHHSLPEWRLDHQHNSPRSDPLSPTDRYNMGHLRTLRRYQWHLRYLVTWGKHSQLWQAK